MKRKLSKPLLDVLICGAGASGRLNQRCPGLSVQVLEATNNVLRKVKISGGGRCNVTSGVFWRDFPDDFNPRMYRELDSFYPRGGSRLGKSFAAFGFPDMIDWFTSRGVELVREGDGRVFPSTNDSQTIIDVLLAEASGIPIKTRSRVTGIELRPDGTYIVLASVKHGDTRYQERFHTRNLVLSPGSSRQLWQLLASMGVAVAEPVPSLFTLNVAGALEGLAGVSVPHVTVSAPEISDARVTGPVVITHRGLSGPAVLKLSSIAALEFNTVAYKATLEIDWTGGLLSKQDLLAAFDGMKSPGKVKSGIDKLRLDGDGGYKIPKRLWARLVDGDDRWNTFSKQRQHAVAERVLAFRVRTTGKDTYKDEFVTAGGVKLEALTSDFELRDMKNVFCIGEFTNVDGVTGGFNFSNCWTSAWAAANAILKQQRIGKANVR